MGFGNMRGLTLLTYNVRRAIYSLNSLKDYIGDVLGDYYRGLS